MKNTYKALEAIEVLVGGDFGMDMEWLLYDKREKKIDPRLIQSAEIISKIYQIVHSETIHSCQHPDWENIKYDILSKAEKANIIS
jgi:hypothetical protein